MAEGFRFMPLGLVKLRTFRLSAGVNTRVRGGRVTQRCHNKMGNRVTKCGWRHAPEARGGFWGFRRKYES